MPDIRTPLRRSFARCRSTGGKHGAIWHSRKTTFWRRETAYVEMARIHDARRNSNRRTSSSCSMMRPAMTIDHNLSLCAQYYHVRRGMPVRMEAARTLTNCDAVIAAGSRIVGHATHTCAAPSSGAPLFLVGPSTAAMLDAWSTLALLCKR